MAAAAATAVSQRKGNELKASRDRRKENRKEGARRADQKALAQGAGAADGAVEASRRLAEQQRAEAQGRADAAAHALAQGSEPPGEAGERALPAPGEEWDLGDLLEDDAAAAEPAAAAAAASTGKASGTGAVYGTTTAAGSGFADSGGASFQGRRRANNVRARLLEVWARPLHAAKHRPRHERLARHLLDK